MSRAVVDTNVIVSGLIGGVPRAVLTHWQNERFVLFLSPAIRAEYSAVLLRFSDLRQDAEEFLRLLRERENIVTVTPSLRLQVIAADPSDDKFLECALAARADVIISGDRHLLALGEFRGIPILTPAQWLGRGGDER